MSYGQASRPGDPYQLDYRLQQAEDAKKVIAEYQAMPESAQIATIVVNYLQSWEFMFLVVVLAAYRLAKQSSGVASRLKGLGQKVASKISELEKA